MSEPVPLVPVPLVLVPLDGSAPARSALPVAEGLVRALGGSLQVLHVAPVALAAAEAHRRLDADHADVVRTATGDPARAILAALRPGAIVVMTRHCGHPRAGSGLGHVAEAVLQSSDVPVVLVPPSRGDAPWSARALLLPLDGAPGSAAAMRHAIRIAGAHGHLTLLHVAGPNRPRPDEPGTFVTPMYEDQPQHEWGAWRSEFADRARCGAQPPCPTRVRVTRGAPGTATAHAAADLDADLVVVAWHGCLDAGHADTLRALLTEAPCPVLVVRAR